ncbi:ATP-dependent DNA helicase DinG [Shimwellia blattae]|uniref:ATP-dependent DNA helicase DinG n=1 Tax=Shimwellia blattae (strain ATCC 29907 / DSM 4481 / JCM 1650 / NBRC 105725 / CDC 9005-74) TaxID=630626 RepID=I2BAY5_SHIBC|nr:ATP-dependent DNA helicase DinG [Shimwellia blattae]AFJ47689.1 ATP-dependent helicase DinG [Shimwellia blattae DSM 4481 = NBRC 105725]GAB79731.1 ATP-dependent DNA helicase DinG [Shimwellia blattae DSM 4481 = NBRC 105725]VDY65189.1 Probable ATP-dependent helicase dinG homolog [Shimwellia blattae]VEC23844.1 Probable ATP-dependent helicase dinG homolog [Shimwellia blattae]
MALSAAVKAQISAWYKALQQQIPDFIPRAPQRQMIAEVAKTLAGEEGRHLAIEAPTGVGKTLSYLIPGIALARDEQKTLVVSTANVALQDQIFSKDLPLLGKIIPELKFTAAFGRGRYVCPRNLSMLACGDADHQGDLLAFLDDDMAPASQAEQTLCAGLQNDLASYRWDGLRDHSHKTIEDSLWARLSTDKASCLGRNCHWYRECPFFVARKAITEAEVVVANHALVMAALESDAVLPEAKNMLLVLDEGHHLPDVARDALEMSAEITGSWVRLQLDLFIKLVATCREQFRPKSMPPLANPERLSEHCDEVAELLGALNQVFSQLLPPQQEAEYRFPMGELPEEILAHAQRLAKLTDGLRGLAEALLNDLSERTGQQDIVRLHRALLQMNRALGHFEAQSKLWKLAAMVQASGAPVSKWVSRQLAEGQPHLYLHCVGIRVSDQLEKLLWRSVPHVVVTSATLRSLNRFDRLQELSGLKEKAGDRFVSLPSPFHHVDQGKILIPRMRYEPSIDNEPLHLAEMATFFRQELAKGEHKGMLVLFASMRALQCFLTFVTDLRLTLLVQGDKPRYRLVELHRKRIEKGETSVLVGLQSFAEGLDLKGEYLTQVHIHKIAFPPVDSPPVVTEGEWLKSLKRYPFEVQSLPSASFNLIQQVGRLIRSHSCWGEVIIYDRRLLTKNYGKRLLDALPVFPLSQPEVPEAIVKAKTVTTRKRRKR